MLSSAIIHILSASTENTIRTRYREEKWECSLIACITIEAMLNQNRTPWSNVGFVSGRYDASSFVMDEVAACCYRGLQIGIGR